MVSPKLNGRCILFLLALFSAPGALPAFAGTDALKPGQWTLSTDGETFSLTARGASVLDVIQGINDATGTDIRVKKVPEEAVTVRYTSIPLEALLDRLGVSYVLTYVKEKDQQPRLTDGWVGDFGRPSPAPAGPAGGPGAPSPPGATPEALQRVFGALTDADREGDLGVRSRTAFPVTMKVDGSLSDWNDALPWQKVTHDRGMGSATNDADASMEFATVADQTNLYVAIKISDDERVMNPEESGDPLNEDSIELLLGEELSLIQRHHVWRKNRQGEITGSGRQYVRLNNGMKAYVTDKNDGWFIEASIPLEGLADGPQDQASLPFNLRLNDDDDGGKRDHVLIWSNTDRLKGARPAEGSTSTSLLFVDLSK